MEFILPNVCIHFDAFRENLTLTNIYFYNLRFSSNFQVKFVETA